MKLINPEELEKVLRPILTDESCPLHISADIDMNIDLMPKVDAIPVEWLEQLAKQHEETDIIKCRLIADLIRLVLKKWKDDNNG